MERIQKEKKGTIPLRCKAESLKRSSGGERRVEDCQTASARDCKKLSRNKKVVWRARLVVRKSRR